MVKRFVYVFILALFLQHHPAAATSYPVLYVAPGGLPSWPCGIDAAQPCSSIATAVARVNSYATNTIRVARGNYTESIFISGNFPVPGPGPLTIEGGWDSGFGSQLDDPSLTTVTHGPGGDIFYLEPSLFGKIALRLKNLTLQGTPEDSYSAVRIANNKQGTAELGISSCSLRNWSAPAVHSATDAAGHTVLNVDKSLIENNGGDSGSAVMLFGYTAAIIDAAFTGNRFFNNAAGNYNGGGIYFMAGELAEITADLQNNIFAGNSAAMGGALALQASLTGSVEVTVTNNTITENQCQSGGGGILVSTQDEGAASLYIRNSIVRGNTGSTDLHILQNEPTSTAAVNASYSLIGPHFTIEPESYTTNETYDKDPMLDSRYHLSPGSPARDSGRCGFYLFSSYLRIAPYDDIDGETRPGYGETAGCDIGADEYYFPWILFHPAFMRKQ